MSADAKKIAAAQSAVTRIRANDRALSGCAGHDFSTVAESSLSPGIFGIEVFLTCTHCGGEITAEAARWYERGIEHGRRKPSRR